MQTGAFDIKSFVESLILPEELSLRGIERMPPEREI
jgi:hypothetical protein